MNVTLPLDKMTTTEKLQVMEDLWNDLRDHDAEIPSPEWHEQVLKEREQKIQDGSAKISDWEVAKNRIREACHENPND